MGLKKGLRLPARASSKLAFLQAGIVLAVLGSWGGSLTGRLFAQRAPSAKAPRSTTDFRNTRPGVAYVGSQACAQCHLDISQSFAKTDMGRSMSLPANRPDVGSMPMPGTVHDKNLDRYFEVSAGGSDLYQSEYQQASDGREVFRDTRKIDYIIGAGENGFGYIVRRGPYLFEAPLSYYVKGERWELSPGFQFADYGFTRPILTGCIFCHSGRSRPVPGRDDAFEDPPFEELAIGCENCHGPGGLHVEERRKAGPWKGLSDTTIVNPAKLPLWLADNICMDCHEGGDLRIPQPGKNELDFRPGTPLDRTIAVFSIPLTPARSANSPLLKHYSLMILSKCYLGTAGKLACVTCHDPHRQPAGAEAVAYYRQKCLGCHTEHSCSVPLASRLERIPADDCAGCHMPKQALQLITHSALTNHRIIARPDEPLPAAAFHQTTPALPDLVHFERQ